MPFVRKIVNSNVLAGIIDIPEALQNKRVEVIIFSLDDNSTTVSQIGKTKKAKGFLDKYKNTALIEKESAAWAEAATGKHEHR
ncbi:hypothetical protein [Methylomusa anaerophila]|uniref:Uncharacterized protein n=1 Tax=Methylomusa anaerophila TaxID=1930071 RepID=A0A348AL36_9FIRM|nr:hypothetical protein [Methylomusa anaerophila]BBB91784.1 hypothetical protein MAMMFC1_02469 [Methylomusa anaerophila]